ncbi:MAG: nucleotide exchange factor GrpE [Patescibacteria group bacterium]|jgi:molecular chaperone GrpE
MSELKTGRYRHFKGREYRLLNLAKGSDQKQDLVVYQDLKDEKKIWVRTKEEFLSQVETKSGVQPRFEFIEAETDSWENKYLRALADYQNLVKQQVKEKESFIKYALEDFLQEILPVYDHLKMSVANLSEAEQRSPWVQGVNLVLKQFKEVLAVYGVTEIKTVGEKFDHDTMEAVAGTGDIVQVEVKPGYKLQDRVIRPAKVKVADKK